MRTWPASSEVPCAGVPVALAEPRAPLCTFDSPDIAKLLSCMPTPCPVLVNIGPCSTPRVARMVPDVLKRCAVTCSARVRYDKQPVRTTADDPKTPRDHFHG